jgi:FlaA1/EpsC-like NDP-sugar epimerase
VYGATKRIGELLVLAMAERSATVYCAVRFGNVIGSRGSVVPIFTRQISRGGPVEVTHPDAARYYLTIPEAVSLVIQAASFAEQGQMFMLDMGEEVFTKDLAEKMIRLKGLQPGTDVPIVYTGLRPGEKVREELVAAHEQQVPTHHPKVMLTFGGVRVPLAGLEAAIDALAANPPAERGEWAQALHRLARLGPLERGMQKAVGSGDAPGADVPR